MTHGREAQAGLFGLLDDGAAPCAPDRADTDMLVGERLEIVDPVHGQTEKRCMATAAAVPVLHEPGDDMLAGLPHEIGDLLREDVAAQDQDRSVSGDGRHRREAASLAIPTGTVRRCAADGSCSPTPPS